MDLHQKLNEYKQYVETCLTSAEINKPNFYAIAVFKALAELIQHGHVTKHASGLDIIERKTLQQHVQMTFPAKDNTRRQEVNKYLSQRYANATALEPDFIEFVFDEDPTVYQRHDEVTPGSRKTGYRIADFAQKGQLIDFLLNLDLQPAYKRLSGETLVELFDEYVQKKSYATSGWYTGYQKTFNQVKDDAEISDETLKLLWYKRDNSVSSLRQGAPSHKEFEAAKLVLRELTERIRSNPTAETYQQAQQVMKQAKADGLLNKMYWALLNRVFAAIAPTICTSTVDEGCFRSVASYLNERFSLGMSLDGDWFEMNQEYKEATAAHLPEGYDPLFTNMATWHLYEDLKEGRLDKIREDSQTGYEVNPPMSTENAFTPLNQILYGPPGTGKTYLLQQRQANYTSQLEVQERDIWLNEKLSPLNWMQVLTLCLLDVNGKAKVKQLVEHEYFQCKAKLNNRDKNLSNTAWAALQSFTVLSSKTVDYKSHSEPAIFDKTEDAFWFIVDDKRELVDDLIELCQTLKAGPQSAEKIERFSSTTFHQSYGYEEFIEGLKATTDDEGNIHYSVEPGAFLKLCKRAENDPDHRYAMFIDEINRGNISKIFGELITLIEPDKRAECQNAMSVKLAYSGADFSVPANVDIIGTMNTADRSLALMDTALRRRFDFAEMMPKPELFQDTPAVEGINLQKLLTILNQRIEVLYDREHTLGHAFFMPVKTWGENGEGEKAFVELQSVFKNKIIPLLEEYFFEDWNKIRLVLGDNQKNDKALQFVTEAELDDNALACLFGRGHGLNQYGEAQKQYRLKDEHASVWRSAAAYKGIYAPNTVAAKAMTENGELTEDSAAQEGLAEPVNQ